VRSHKDSRWRKQRYHNFPDIFPPAGNDACSGKLSRSDNQVEVVRKDRKGYDYTIVTKKLNRPLGENHYVAMLESLCAFSLATQAQSATDGSTPAGYTAGAPVGSYSLKWLREHQFLQRQSQFHAASLEDTWTWGIGARDRVEARE
jgi:hypothetical protein